MRKYEVSCGYCEHFLTQTIKGNVTIFSEGICNVKNTYIPVCEEICEKFILRSGLYTTKSYPKSNT